MASERPALRESLLESQRKTNNQEVGCYVWLCYNLIGLSSLTVNPIISKAQHLRDLQVFLAP